MPEIQGKCDPRFEGVYREFQRNFTERGEVGGSVNVTIEGETVVDLWGGTADQEKGTPWKEDTVCLVWSSTKGAVSLCAHILNSRKEIDLDLPVSKYWPEFGKNGKENITVKMLLNHQAGVPHIRKELKEGAFYDWEYMVKALEEEEPFWKPGTRNGYHPLSFGWLVGEIIRRVTGQSVGTFFHKEVAKPLGLEFWIGLPEEMEPHVAPMIAPPPPTQEEMMKSPFFQAMADKSSVPYLMTFNTGGYTKPGVCDTREAHAAEIPAAGGITNARGLAGLYAPLACGGNLRGINLVDQDSIIRMSSVYSATGEDFTLLIPTRFTLGYMKAMDNRRQPPGRQDSLLISESAFGHNGYGGSIGFADPDEKMSFGYTMNQMGQGMAVNERGQSLIDAVYQGLGYRSTSAGVWTK